MFFKLCLLVFILWATPLSAQADMSSIQEQIAPRIANHKTVTTLDHCLSALPPEERVKLKSSTKPYGECLLLLRQMQKKTVTAGAATSGAGAVSGKGNAVGGEDDFEGGGFVQVAPLLSSARRKEVQKKISQEEALSQSTRAYPVQATSKARSSGMRKDSADAMDEGFQYNR